MHHLFAYAGSVAQNAVLANVPAIVDEVLALFTATTYTPERDMRLLRLYGRGDSVSQIRLDSPLLRQVGPPQIQPFDTGAEPTTLPPINKYDGSSMTWIKNDPLAMLMSRAGAGAAVCQVLGWISDQVQRPIEMPAIPVRATSSVTLTTTSWVSAPLTLDQSLPPGKYKIVGMSSEGTSLLASRLILPGQTWRPGCLAQDSAGEYDHEWFRRGNFGDYGEFESYSPPTVQHLGLAAGASTPIVWLDLVRLSGRASF